ncbi:MAG TPA: hypothetical protein ENK57_00265 [Polyangiaceae bacterium]|nr:hypothetical protein [Polyangiaceae bacterium]
MSSFGKRLARLQGTASSTAPSADDEAEPVDPSFSAVRAALQRALGSASSAPGVAAGRVDRPLPFEVLLTAAGPVEHRELRREVTRRIGNVSLDAATATDPRMLSLLALTPALAEVPADRFLFLDTETSGLGSGTANVPFLVGMAYFEGRELVLEQLFLRERDDEAALLARVEQRVRACEAIVTFNGKSFDLPVLRARFVMNGLPEMTERPHLDLLHLARRVHRHRHFKKSLTVLEREVLGFRRGPDVHGEEVAARYRHYLRSGDTSGLHAVVEHNEHDVVSLAALTTLYGEPARQLPASELASAARAVRRAGAMEDAVALADLAVRRGAGEVGLRARAEIAKARGDKEQALADFEALAATVSDPDVRLELAKLYEHHCRRPADALKQVALGTGESEADRERRRRRLERKRARQRGEGEAAEPAKPPRVQAGCPRSPRGQSSHPPDSWARVRPR